MLNCFHFAQFQVVRWIGLRHYKTLLSLLSCSIFHHLRVMTLLLPHYSKRYGYGPILVGMDDDNEGYDQFLSPNSVPKLTTLLPLGLWFRHRHHLSLSHHHVTTFVDDNDEYQGPKIVDRMLELCLSLPFSLFPLLTLPFPPLPLAPLVRICLGLVWYVPIPYRTISQPI